MKRRHLFEFTDLPRCPGVVRRLVTDYLATVIHGTRAYAPAAEPIARALAASGARRIVDLCSGGSGPLIDLARDGALGVDVVMTDRFPDPVALGRARDATGGRLDFVAEPVDARAVPASLDGLRTIFSGLHHFRPEEVRAILGDAVRAGAPFAAFEGTRRSAGGVLSMLLVPLVVLAVTPFIRPRAWWRFALTYLVPVAPLVVAWDALVSSLRSYTPDELRGLAASAGAGYAWEAGELRRRGATVTYLIGWKRTP